MRIVYALPLAVLLAGTFAATGVTPASGQTWPIVGDDGGKGDRMYAQPPTPVSGAQIPSWLIGTWEGTQKATLNLQARPADNTTTFRPDGTWSLDWWSYTWNNGAKGEGTFVVEGETVILKGRYTQGRSGNLSYTLSGASPGKLTGTGIGGDGTIFNVDLKKQ
jgi:hypothetical protein